MLEVATIIGSFKNCRRHDERGYHTLALLQRGIRIAAWADGTLTKSKRPTILCAMEWRRRKWELEIHYCFRG